MSNYFVALFISAIAPLSAGATDDALLQQSDDRAAFDWSGSYIGAVAGYDRGNGDNHFPNSPGAEADATFSGAVFGVYGGYNWRHGNMVYGVDAEITSSTVDGIGENGSKETIHTELGLTASMRARIGYAFNDLLIYGSVGLATTDAAVRGVKSNGVDLFASANDWLTGWTIGAGAEYALTDKLLGRLEYRHSDYGSIAYQAVGGPGSVDVKMNSLVLGVSYKF